jgi:hypothetical protein
MRGWQSESPSQDLVFNPHLKHLSMLWTNNCAIFFNRIRPENVMATNSFGIIVS